MNTRERLAFVQDYREWRENQELLGKPSGLDDYEEVVLAQEPKELLTQIRHEALKVGGSPDIVRLTGFRERVLTLTEQRKEIEAA